MVVETSQTLSTVPSGI